MLISLKKVTITADVSDQVLIAISEKRMKNYALIAYMSDVEDVREDMLK